LRHAPPAPRLFPGILREAGLADYKIADLLARKVAVEIGQT
jgi:hypothetical protein